MKARVVNNAGKLDVWGTIRWELIRWGVVLLGMVPGIAGILVRYVFYLGLTKSREGFFRILEGVIIEYPEGLSIGKNSGINAGSWINARGNVKIGAEVIIGPYCIIHSANHISDDLEMPIQYQGHQHEPVVIEDNVWLGARVTVLPGVRIGSGAIVGAGSVVTKDIPSNAIATGTPAQVIRIRGNV